MRKPSPSDWTDEQWEIIEPLIPVSRVGRPREVARREGLNAILSPNRSGCPWQTIRDALRPKVRRAAGRRPSPSAGSSDSPTVQATASAADRGDDGGQKITGRTRHLSVDPLGLLLVVVVTVASADDGTIAPAVRGRRTAEPRSRLERLGGDGKDHNPHRDGWLVETTAGYRIEVGGRPAGSGGFVTWPRRWVVERTFAWFGRDRRNSRDDERFTDSSAAMIKISSIHRILRLLKPDQGTTPVPFKYRDLQGKITG